MRRDGRAQAGRRPARVNPQAAAAPPAAPPPTPAPSLPNLRLSALKASPLLQSQDILATLHCAVDSAGDDLLVTERNRGILSARSAGQGAPPSPLSRFMAETAFQEKKHMIAALDRAATARATAPAAAHAAPRLLGSGAEQPAAWQRQGSSSSKRGLRALFACFGR